MRRDKSSTINTALIGHGYWGKNLLRNLVENPLSGTITVCDRSAEKLQTISSSFKTVVTSIETAACINSAEIDAVVIATPTSTHYALAKQALLNGKHVLIEKPFCTSTKEAEELCELAEKNNLILMVDHIYLYNPVVAQLKEYINQSPAGVSYIDSTRINLGIYQTDTNVLWDLACHDISIVNYLIDETPVAVRAIGRTNNIHGIHDIAYVYLHYSSGVLVHINSSWASPVKMRKMIVGTENRMIIYDDIEPTEKLTIYDYGKNAESDANKSFLIDYRLGNITIPKCKIQEPLKNVIAEFYNGINCNVNPLSDGRNALQTVKILEVAQKSLSANGELLPLS